MTPWAITASARDVDAHGRAAMAEELVEWLEDGGSGVALVTCHRAELYGLGSPPAAIGGRVEEGSDAVTHLMRVACGLESVIVGEDEVLHQVRGALRHASAGRRLDPRLRRLFETAIAAGRRARSGRTQSQGNLAGSAVEWLSTKADILGRTVVIAGAGRMGAALAHSARAAGSDVIIASRNSAKASRLARVYDGRGVTLSAAAEMALHAAGVAVALGGPWGDLALVAAADLPPVADISAPQSVPDTVRRRLDGRFLGIDDLYRPSGPPPTAYIEDARRVIARKSAEYLDWLRRVDG